MAKDKYRRSKPGPNSGSIPPAGGSPRHSHKAPPSRGSVRAAAAVPVGTSASAAKDAGALAEPHRSEESSGLWKWLGLGGTSAADPRRLFRRVDWLCFWAASSLTFLVYLFTLAPDLTLEDCGELAVASYWAGVPHAPGYPIWTLYTFLFANLLPIANVAFRVAVSSAVAAALANGLLGLMVSRGSSMLLEGIPSLRGIGRRQEDAICLTSGMVAALLIGFNGFMWSQAVIVEVYTLSVLSLMGVLVCLMHWVYRPENRRYLLAAAFLFGICFNNHQTLIVAAMGLEVLIALVDRRLGRDAFLANSVIYIVGAAAMGLGWFNAFDQNRMLLAIFHAVGLGSILACVWLIYQTGGLLSEWRTVLAVLGMWLLGASFYLIMPWLSVTNPPMNWAYPRTWQGFWHAFSRGQYERTNPTDLFAPGGLTRFASQLIMYFSGAVDEFHLVFLFLGAIPFFFLRHMQQRERAWILGNTAIYCCLAFLLLMLLNPNPDRQSRDLTRVFFTASHVIIAMFAGFGLTLVAGYLLRHYQEARTYALYGGATAAALALFALTLEVQEAHGDPLEGFSSFGVLWRGFWTSVLHPSFTPPVFGIWAAWLVLLLVVGFTAVVLVRREWINLRVCLCFFAAVPLFSIVAHWPANEQRGHLFGFWFGHDMFKPPYDLYPEMAKNAILFGGTDPGRFCPTYMIFCESFIKPSRRRDPTFDRRDVYIITQNALADGTYLDYIRAHYYRSAQKDPPFARDAVLWLSDRFLPAKERLLKEQGLPYETTFLSRAVASLTNLVAPFDRLYLKFGEAVEKRRRARGLYPAKEIYTPSAKDLTDAFDQYMNDAARRFEHDRLHPDEPKQVKPGEVFTVTPDGRIQVQGQVAVMAINAILTKIIFDRNPDHEFYVEESFPLDWMYPHLRPYGIIMKIEREPIPELTEEDLRRDHEFWSRYSERLCGNWITYDTPIKEICDFVDRVYRRGDLRGYTGDPAFVRDSDAQKSFAKLRGSIAGLYDWRLRNTTNTTERARLLKEAEFACKQAFAFCPYSPESVARFVQLLALMNRMDEALMVAETAYRFDVESDYLRSVIQQLQGYRQGVGSAVEASKLLQQYEAAYRQNPTNITAAMTLVSAYATLGRTNDAFRILDEVVNRPETSPEVLMAVAESYVQLGQYGRAESALRRLVTLMPQTPELWYDLAGAQVALGQYSNALASLEVCFRVNDQRRGGTNQVDLRALAATDSRFRPLRGLKAFQDLLRTGAVATPSPESKP